VGTLASGRRLRCACGQVNVVPEPSMRVLPMQQCATCGAALEAGATRCDYCSASVTLDDRGWGESCPSCHARMVKGAKFCSSCGIAIRPNPIRKTDTEQKCPRCGDPLMVCTLPNGHFTECTGCGGVWLEESSFDRLAERHDRSGAVGSVFAAPDRVRQALAATRIEDSGYLKCPVCGTLMNRTNFARISGIIIDRCAGHGYWFDTHELERVFAFIADGGLDKARAREVDRQRELVFRAKAKAGHAERMARRAGMDANSVPTPSTKAAFPLLETLHYWLFR